MAGRAPPIVKDLPALRSHRASSEFPPISQSISKHQSRSGLRGLFGKKPTRPLSSASEQEDRAPLRGQNAVLAEREWIPPPLFQAYAQSVRYTSLEACTLSAETIVRMHEQRLAAPTQDGNPYPGAPDGDGILHTPKSQKTLSLSDKVFWTRKLYILTASGHLLKYHGVGPTDRKPEQILQLGKDSAAFATDVIDGRHFVLQISQSCNEEGEQNGESAKGLLSRMGIIKVGGARRTAKILLMVFNSAPEFDIWLSVLRKMIENLGGRSYTGESSKVASGASMRSDESWRYSGPQSPGGSIVPGHLGFNYNRPLSNQSSSYTATELDSLCGSKTSTASILTQTPTTVIESPLLSPASEKLPPPLIPTPEIPAPDTAPPDVPLSEHVSEEPQSAESPHMAPPFLPVSPPEIPQIGLSDLGPSSLGDFPKKAKRQSRLSLMFSELTRRKSLDSSSIGELSKQGLAQSDLSMQKEDLNEDEAIMEENIHDLEGPPEDTGYAMIGDDGEPADERTTSLDVQFLLPASLRHSSSESVPGSRLSRPLSITLEGHTSIPKRFSSLAYSQSFWPMQLAAADPDELPPTEMPSPEKALRRPTSMQMRQESGPVAHVPERSPSLLTAGSEPSVFTPDSQNGIDVFCTPPLTPRVPNIAYGPPAGPPPSCPLPAIPPGISPLRRRSLPAREAVPFQALIVPPHPMP